MFPANLSYSIIILWTFETWWRHCKRPMRCPNTSYVTWPIKRCTHWTLVNNQAIVSIMAAAIRIKDWWAIVFVVVLYASSYPNITYTKMKQIILHVKMCVLASRCIFHGNYNLRRIDNIFTSETLLVVCAFTFRQVIVEMFLLISGPLRDIKYSNNTLINMLQHTVMQ